MIESITVVKGDVNFSCVNISMLAPCLVSANMVKDNIGWRDDGFGGLVAVITWDRQRFSCGRCPSEISFSCAVKCWSSFRDTRHCVSSNVAEIL
jgi:hypothetical protein